MQFTEVELGSNVLKLQEDEACTVYQVQDDTGEGKMTFYQVFHGCCLIYNDFHLEKCSSEFQPNMRLFCIDHCRESPLPEPF